MEQEIVVDIQDGPSESPEIGQVALDILESEEYIHIVAPLAGIPMDNVSISLAQNVLTIGGEREEPDVYEDSTKLLVNECFFGPFSRSVILPENLAFSKIKATMENQLLVVSIPKVQYPSRTIKINKLDNNF